MIAESRDKTHAERMHPVGCSIDDHDMRPALRRALSVAALLLVACDEHVGCTPELQGENGQLVFHDETLVVGAADRMHSVRAIVEGSSFCPTLGCVGDVPGCTIDEDDDVRLPEDDVRQCFTSTIDGPITIEGTCVRADAPGMLDWQLAPRTCPANGQGYAPTAERLRLPIVDGAALQPWLQSTGDGWAMRELVDETGGKFDGRPQLALGNTAYVLADHTVHFAVVLTHPSATDPVAWDPREWSVTTLADDGSTPAAELDAWGVVALALPADAKVELTLHRDALALPLGRVEAVAESAIDSLEIVVGFIGDEDAPDGHRTPVGARAIARTADDRIVYGVPVEWSITKGALPLWRDDELQWDPDFTALADRDSRGCHPPPDEATTYRVDLLATWGELEDRDEIEWTEPKTDESTLEKIAEWFKGGEDWDAADTCAGPGFPSDGCGRCDTNGGGAAPLAILVVLALRRRRLSRPVG